MTWKKAGAAVLLLICIMFIYIRQDLLFQVPFAELEFSNVVYVTKDEQENMLVLDASGSRLRKVSKDNELLWEVNASDEGLHEGKRVAVIGNCETGL